MSKHRKMKSKTKKFAAVTAATATTAALTIGAAPSPDKEVTWRDVLLTAGPDYFQLIEDMSNSYDNILVAQGNLGGSAADFLAPFAAASGGLLPSFSAGTMQTNLDTVSEILAALSQALDEGTDVSVVPGISNEAAATVLQGMLAGLGVDLGLVGTLGAVIGYLGVLNGTLSDLGDLVDVVNNLDTLDLLDDISLSDLLGLTATQTEFTAAYSWLGLNGLTKMGNTYVNLNQITIPGLIDNLEDVLPDLLGSNSTLGELLDALGLGLDLGNIDLGTIDDLVESLDLIATPEVTAWIPAASGAYDLPLGGSLGYLAAMPTIAIGPLSSILSTDVIDLGDLGLDNLDGLVDLDSATVIAIPIFAAGGELPLGLASFGGVNANVLFPTATGVTSLAGTSLQTFDIPLLSSGVTNLNTLQAWYVGTNGFNYNSGQSVLLANVGGLPIPIEYSMGAVNFGTSGVGVTLPSLFGVGLVPSFQIGTPVGQESSDGLIGRDILNLGLNTPTQATNVATLIGLGGMFDPAEAAGTAGWNAAVKPVGDQVKNYLNDNVGEWANGAASQFEQLTGSVADATGGDQSASTMSLASAKPAAQINTPDTGTSTPAKANDLTNVSAQINDSLNETNAAIASAVNKARAQSDAAVKRAQTQLNKIAADGQKAIKDTVDGVNKAVKDTVKKVSDSANSVAKKKEAAS